MAIDIKTRASLIKPGSTVYNYYMTTPLSEFKTKEDKLLKKELEALSEVNTQTKIDDTHNYPENMFNILTESNVSPQILLEAIGDSDDDNAGFLSRLGSTMKNYVTSGYDYVVDKVTELENRFSQSENGLVRAVPKIITTALAVLAIYYLWDKYKSEIPTPNLGFDTTSEDTTPPTDTDPVPSVPPAE